MASAEITAYAAGITAFLTRSLGAQAPTEAVDGLNAAANHLASLAEAPAATAAEWQAAVNNWIAARATLDQYLGDYLLDGLPAIPGLDALAEAVGWDSAEGLNGSLPLGPLKLTLSSSSLTIQPTLPGGIVAPALTVGPYQPSGISASLASPFGSGMPGGGSVVRLLDGAGFAGALNIPLGPVTIEATAILERMQNGTPSFLAVMGIGFTPPIQLSFGFSLDRVGGLVGINRTADSDALALALRSGTAGDTLFASSPPANPSALISNLRTFFPSFQGRHLIAPTLRVSWLSMGSKSLLSLDVAVVVELPTGRVIIIGVARASIPNAEGLLQLRLDVMGMIDPTQSLVSIDAHLVDSHVLGVFTVYGSAAMRMSWGTDAYSVLTIGGFYPGFNPEPARLPALRRVGMSLGAPVSGIKIRVEGYFAVTTNTIHLGGELDVSISMGVSAHGFLKVNALVQFRPFQFVATCTAGFDVRAGGFTFCGIRLDGTISGPGPMVIHGKLTIDTFLFDLSWDETFTIGRGPADMLPSPLSLLDAIGEEIGKPGNFRAVATDDPAVVLKPRATRAGYAAVPPTGQLQWVQRRAPLGFPIDRVDGQPLAFRQGVAVSSPGATVQERFSPGSYCTLTKAERLSRPPFDILDAGIVLAAGAQTRSAPLVDDRKVDVIVILGRNPLMAFLGEAFDLGAMAEMVAASKRAPALSDSSGLIGATRESWSMVTADGVTSGHGSATAAHQFAKSHGAGAFAVSGLDAASSLDLAGI